VGFNHYFHVPSIGAFPEVCIYTTFFLKELWPVKLEAPYPLAVREVAFLVITQANLTLCQEELVSCCYIPPSGV